MSIDEHVELLSIQIRELAKAEDGLRILQQAFDAIGLREVSNKLNDLAWNMHDITQNLRLLDQKGIEKC